VNNFAEHWTDVLDICSAYGEEWDIKFNLEKSCVGTIGGNHPSAKVELVAKSLQWRDHVKYLGCMLRCKSCNVAWNNCFRKIFNACWRESVKPLLFFCSCLPLSYIIDQRRLLYWKKCLFSGNVLLRTLARCCYDNIGSLCDIYKFTVKNLVDSPKYLVKELFWREFERAYIVWQRIVL